MIECHTAKFRQAIESFQCGRKDLWMEPSDAFVNWLEAKEIPQWLRDHLLSAALRTKTEVGVACFRDPARIMRDHEKDPQVLQEGFLQIGSASNGDPIVVDVRSAAGVVGYLSHEALWPTGKVEFYQVSESLGLFAMLAKNIDGCPMDFYGTLPSSPSSSGVWFKKFKATISGLVFLSLLLVSTHWHRNRDLPFDAHAWEIGNPRMRGRMVDELIASKMLDGKTDGEVASLLGSGGGRGKDRNRSLVYVVDVGHRFLFDPWLYRLEVEFDANNIVSAYYLAD